MKSLGHHLLKRCVPLGIFTQGAGSYIMQPCKRTSPSPVLGTSRGWAAIAAGLGGEGAGTRGDRAGSGIKRSSRASIGIVGSWVSCVPCTVSGSGGRGKSHHDARKALLGSYISNAICNIPSL